MRDCPRCGSTGAAARADAAPRRCPSCRELELCTRGLKGLLLSSCPGCGGVWADEASFRKLCEDRSVQAAYLGKGSVLPAPASSDPTAGGAFYRPCPACAELMNRFNFAGCSGVVLDACKPHGVWFDADELRRIVVFIRGGGLDLARTQEIEKLQEERHRLESAAQQSQGLHSWIGSPRPEPIIAASGLIAYFLKRDA